MRKSLIAILLVVIPMLIKAQYVPVDDAKSLGTKFLQNEKSQNNVDLKLVYTEKNDAGVNCFYIFNNTKGFVIVSADKRAKPILAYSTESTFKPSAMSDGVQDFFRSYNEKITYVIENQSERDSKTVEQWSNLEKYGKINIEKNTRSVAPLLKTIWNQSDLYNEFCPEDEAGYGGHVKSGCVANAMSQLMNYWEWPKTGTGSHGYEAYGLSGGYYGYIEVNFGDANYEFEFMPEFLDYTTPRKQLESIALLEYHAGVSVEMMYGPTGSGAYSYDVPDALENYFRYAQECTMKYKDYYGADGWEDMLRENLDAGEPLLYSSSGPDGGHAYICDGYDENEMFHFNWGWQGFDNGYFYIDALNLTYHSFNDWHYTTCNCHPNDEYYQQPKGIENVNVTNDYYTYVNTIEFTVPSEKINGEVLNNIDSILVFRNDDKIFTFVNPQPGETLSLDDQLDKNQTNYYFIYPMVDGMKGTVAIDTITTGETSEITFNLHDSAGNGWLSPSISILDSRGIVIKRVGLEEGGDATVTVDVPSNDMITFYWNYVNAAYCDADDECSFEIYYDNEQIYASNGKPVVGEFLTKYIEYKEDGISENSQSESFEIYPNPAKNYIAIIGGNVNNVMIFNAVGQMVYSSNENVEKIDISSLKDGVYFVKTNNGAARKLVVAR